MKTAADFEAAMSKVATVSGASGKELEDLTAKAREMGSKTKFSASEAAEAMNYMAMAGWKTEDMLSGIEGVMNLAAASGEDLATTSDIVTDALTAFGLSAQDSWWWQLSPHQCFPPQILTSPERFVIMVRREVPA